LAVSRKRKVAPDIESGWTYEAFMRAAKS